MIKTIALGTLANITAAVGGTVTAVQVLRGKQPTVAAGVTLASLGVGGVAAALAYRQAKKAMAELGAELEKATTAEQAAVE